MIPSTQAWFAGGERVGYYPTAFASRQLVIKTRAPGREKLEQVIVCGLRRDSKSQQQLPSFVLGSIALNWL
jgi:hypothetical protein